MKNDTNKLIINYKKWKNVRNDLTEKNWSTSSYDDDFTKQFKNYALNFQLKSEDATKVALIEEISKLEGWYFKRNKTNNKFKINYQIEMFGQMKDQFFSGEFKKNIVNDAYLFFEYLINNPVLNIQFEAWKKIREEEKVKAEEAKKTLAVKKMSEEEVTDSQKNLIRKIQGIEFKGSKLEACELISKIKENGWKKI